jgi:hypothetical protein
LVVDIRLTDPNFDSFGGYPTAPATFSFSGTNVASTVTATFGGTDNFQSNPTTPIIAYGVQGAPGVLIPDPSQDAVISSMSVSFIAPGGGGSNPDFAGTTLVARADIQARGGCPDSGVLLSASAFDSAAPTASPSQTPAANQNNWNNGPVTVTWNWADELGGSGINPSLCTASSTSSGDGAQTLGASCTDLAGNTGSATYDVRVDTGAPAATPAPSPAPNGAGWNNSAVTVTWNWVDAPGGSGLDPVSCPASTTSSADGTANLPGACTDLAGNSGTSSYLVKVDTVAPSLQPVVTPSFVPLGGTATANPNATDVGGSGVATASCNNGQALPTTTVGVHTVTCTASDVAGNTANVPVSYFVGFAVSNLQPPTKTVFQSGSTIPVKFKVVDAAGRALPAAQVQQIIAAGRLNVVLQTSPTPTTVPATYDPTNNVFQANVKTPSGLRSGSSLTINVTYTPTGQSPFVLASTIVTAK